MKIVFRSVLIMAMAIISINCSSDDSEEPMPDTTVTYEKDIKIIMENHCFGCHIDPPINGAPFALVNYNQVSDKAGDILTAISKQTGEIGAMPRSGRLPQETIDKVAQWIADGLPEN